MLRDWKVSIMSQFKPPCELVSFGDRLTGSPHFDRLFAEGMALVERTASYLDTTGRAEAKRLEGPLSVAYATESMRLTTRLLELASWLMIRRGQRSGELSAEEAAAKRAKLRIGGTGRPSHNANFDALPGTLRGLIEESFSLRDRIMQLDRVMEPQSTEPGDPVGEQRGRLETAFGTRPRLVVSN